MGMNGAGLWDVRCERVWKADCAMLADDTALVTHSEEGLKELVKVFGYMGKRRK